MFPFVIAAIVGVVIVGYAVCALGSVGDFCDPCDWEDEDGEEE